MSGEEKIQQINILEQALQSILLQKQAEQIEISQIEDALREIEKANKEVYRIVGNIMVSKEKEEVKKELEDEKRLHEMKLKTLETQEETYSKKIEEMRKEVIEKK